MTITEMQADINQDILSRPLSVVQTIFEQHFKEIESNPSNERANDWGVSEYFKVNIANRWEQIPSINTTKSLDAIPSGTLVRYRGMIQDMFDPEFYIGAYDVLNTDGTKKRMTGKYCDVIDVQDNLTINPDDDSSVAFDRLPLFCVPIPGENYWSLDILSQSSRYAAPSQESETTSASKRKIADDHLNNEQINNNNSMMIDSTDQIQKENTAVQRPKTATEGDTPMIDANRASNNTTARQQSFEEEKQSWPLHSIGSAPNGPSCLVKIYDHNDETNNSFKLNEVYEFVGIFTVSPQLASFPQGGPNNNMDDEMDTRLPPSSLVPRLHCICYRKLDNLHLAAPPSILMTSQQSSTAVTENNSQLNLLRTVLSSVSSSADTLRKYIVDFIAAGLGGDSLAAEYILLNLISRVYKRVDNLALGNFSLNLMNCPETVGSQNFRRSIARIFEELSPKSVFIPLSINILNNADFCPRKDYATNRLTSGLLQLSEGTSVVLDETSLEPGTVASKGLKQIQAVSNMLLWQRVAYDFEYHAIEFPTDLNTLVLSVGKSMFPCSCNISLKTVNNSTEFVAPSFPAVLSKDFINHLRLYLSACRSLEYQVDESVSKLIQDHFVLARKQDAELKQDTFHLWLTVARLQSLSFGEAALTKERWDYTMQLEAQRLQRVSK